jgi:hypothetical protein
VKSPVWANIKEEKTKTGVKTALLNLFKNEQIAKMRRKVADVIGVLAGRILAPEVKDEEVISHGQSSLSMLESYLLLEIFDR